MADITGLQKIPDAIDGLILRDIKVKEYEIAVECENAVHVENDFSDDVCIRKERVYYDCREIHKKPPRFKDWKQYRKWYISNYGKDSGMSKKQLSDYTWRVWKICARRPMKDFAYYK